MNITINERNAYTKLTIQTCNLIMLKHSRDYKDHTKIIQDQSCILEFQLQIYQNITWILQEIPICRKTTRNDQIKA